MSMACATVAVKLETQISLPLMFLARDPCLHEKPRTVCERAQVGIDLRMTARDRCHGNASAHATVHMHFKICCHVLGSTQDHVAML